MAKLVHRVDPKQIVLTLKMPRAFGFRMWLTVQIFRLAALVAPVTIDLEEAAPSADPKAA